jgi:putative redox protein
MLTCGGKKMSLLEPKAVVHFAGNDLFIGITPSKHALTLDTDHSRGAAPTPVELLLVALGSCTAVDVIGILQKKRADVREYRVEVHGERRDEHPRNFLRMELHHIITARNVSERSVAQAIELSETKYCSVAATLRPTVEIVSSFEIIQPKPDANGSGESSE